jgi:glycosyltransferase involved in cell wall biosynthesis
MTANIAPNRPLVSVGMPIYNEEHFLDASLASLRSQDYPNFEIVIADNASTDRTVEICERHASEDAARPWALALTRSLTLGSNRTDCRPNG